MSQANNKTRGCAIGWTGEQKKMATTKITRTTYEVDGCKEPCILVGEGYAQVRISKCYHMIGSDTLYMTEILGGEVNAVDEFTGDYDLLDDFTAISLAKQFSPYLN